MPLRLLFHIYALGAGGAERVVALLASGLARRGHEVTLAVDFEAAANSGYLDRQVRVLPLGRSHPGSVRALARHLARERPDASLSAVGVSNLKHVLAAALAGRLRRAVVSHHGFYEAEVGLLSRAGNLATPATTRLCARAVFVSDALRDAFVRRFRADPDRSVRIYNPVDGVAYADPASAADLKARAPVVLAVGRLAPVKDLALLVRAFARLERKDARLVLVGDGPERGRIEAEVARLGLAGRVELAGFAAEPWRFYRTAACLACSSRSESFGNVLVEALAHGLPVVSTDCGGPREILEAGRLGALVPVGDEGALAAAIDAVLRDPGEPGPRIRRAEAFALDPVLDAYERLFAEVVRADGRA